MTPKCGAQFLLKAACTAQAKSVRVFGGSSVARASIQQLRTRCLCSSQPSAIMAATGAKRMRFWFVFVQMLYVVECLVQFFADKHDDRREPYPSHETDHRAQRAVGLVVAAKIGGVPGERHRGDQPNQSCQRAAPADPAPGNVVA